MRTPTIPDRPDRILGVVGDKREMGIDKAPMRSCTGATKAASRMAGSWCARAATLRLKLNGVAPASVHVRGRASGRTFQRRAAENRLRTVLLTFFAITAVSLASVGLYRMLSYFVSPRRRLCSSLLPGARAAVLEPMQVLRDE